MPPEAAHRRVSTLPQPVPAAARPSWLDGPAPAEPPPVRLLSPAAAYDESTPRAAWAFPSGEARAKALARGTLVHRLLQSLPDIPAAARADAAPRYLSPSPATSSSEGRDALIAHIA